jgi:hypothetical protein
MNVSRWIVIFVSVLMVTAPAVADQLRAVPFVFIGTAADCAPSPAGSRIVTSAWLDGLGLPDDGGLNGVPATANDPHRGLLLSKNGPTTDCSASGASILGAGRQVLTELGFDYRNGGHCGGGAPRFNVTVRNSVTNTDTFHFVGNCAVGTNSPAPQDPAEWTRIRWTPAQAFPPIPPGSRIKSLSVIFDEGTDQPGAEDPNGIGLATIDNIDVNGQLIGRGTQPRGNNNDDDDDKDDNDNHRRNHDDD